MALGSHANYFEPGLHEFEQECLPAQVIAFFQQAGLPLPADVAAPGPVAGPKRLGIQPAGIETIAEGSPRWVAFPGFWGELEYFSAPAPIGTVPFGTSPVGPAFHEVWQRAARHDRRVALAGERTAPRGRALLRAAPVLVTLCYQGRVLRELSDSS